MNPFHTIQIINLRFQIGYITPNKIRLLEEYDTLRNTLFYMLY